MSELSITLIADGLITLGVWASLVYALFLRLWRSGSPITPGFGRSSISLEDLIIPIVFMIPGLGYTAYNQDSIDFLRLAISVTMSLLIPPLLFAIFILIRGK